MALLIDKVAAIDQVLVCIDMYFLNVVWTHNVFLICPYL